MIIYSRNFKRLYKKIFKKIRVKFEERVTLFIEDEFSPLLNNHSLHGEYKDYRSISISSNYRIIYRKEGNDYYFIAIGTHSELYGR